MLRFTTASILLYSCAVTCSIMAAPVTEVKVTIDPNTQRYLGAECKLDRSKFVAFHGSLSVDGKDEYFEKFKRDYNVGDNYIGSRIFNYPISKINNGVIPDVKQTYSGKRDLYDYIGTTAPAKLFYDKTINYGDVDFMPYIKQVAEYIANSYKSDWELVPKYLEPFNEPMVHAGDFAKGLKGAERTEAIEAIITYICKYHSEVARAIKSTPELKGMQIMGFGSAFPEFETKNFSLWNNRFKQFIDVAGEDVDILSVHLYDGSGVNNLGGRRTGSNLEAIFDIMQTYSYIKLGAPMPIAVTEYGRLVPNNPVWQRSVGMANSKDTPKAGAKPTVGNYDPVINSQAVRSQLSMVMAFMNRQNELVKTVPFSTKRSPRTAMYSKASLWAQQDDGSYEYSNRKYFFEMLKDIKGESVVVSSDDVDVQTLAFVDGNRLYVMLNNLEEKQCSVALDLLATKDLVDVQAKCLKIYEDRTPGLTFIEYAKAPMSIPLEYGETIVITYTYKDPIKFKHSVVRTKYYSKDYLKPIVADKNNKFVFENMPVAKSNGVAMLRLGVNRIHELPKIPMKLRINGTVVKIENDVIKGYDQATRSQFFGALEIPFDISLIKSEENTVEVFYGEDGGYVSTAILQIEQ